MDSVQPLPPIVQHTPLPWAVGPLDVIWSERPEHRIAEISRDNDNDPKLTYAPTNPAERKANAAYIIQACNAFPFLIEALSAILASNSLSDVRGLAAEALRATGQDVSALQPHKASA